MKLNAITTCVGYADKLAKSIHLWRECDLLVVTTPDDHDTHHLCASFRVPWITTNAFTAHGAIFGKAQAIEQGLSVLEPRDWVLFCDADIVPPGNWFELLSAYPLRKGFLYGASRRGENIADRETCPGFFQLWHASDPVAQDRPLMGSWLHAGSYDTAFANRWPRQTRVRLPLIVDHLGEQGVNWCGVGRDDLMRQVWDERNRRGGRWDHERIG